MKPHHPSARPLVVELLEDRTVPATLTVNTTADSGGGSLRQAIFDSNASAGVVDTIVFDVGSGVQTIAPLSAIASAALSARFITSCCT